MTTRALAGVIAAVLGVVFACALCGALVVGGVAAACTTTTSSGATPDVVAPSVGWAVVDGFDAGQVGNAASIVTALYQSVRQFSQNSPQMDDVTAIVLKVAASA